MHLPSESNTTWRIPVFWHCKNGKNGFPSIVGFELIIHMGFSHPRRKQNSAIKLSTVSTFSSYFLKSIIMLSPNFSLKQWNKFKSQSTVGIRPIWPKALSQTKTKSTKWQGWLLSEMHCNWGQQSFSLVSLLHNYNNFISVTCINIFRLTKLCFLKYLPSNMLFLFLQQKRG